MFHKIVFLKELMFKAFHLLNFKQPTNQYNIPRLRMYYMSRIFSALNAYVYNMYVYVKIVKNIEIVLTSFQV